MYRTKPGDTFASIGQSQVGLDTVASDIQRANPGVTEPLIPGTILTVPGLRKRDSSTFGEGLHIEVDGVEFQTVPNCTVGKRIDAIRKASFSVPNENVTRQILIPLFPHNCVIHFDRALLLTGYVNHTNPQKSGAAKQLDCSVHSACAIMENSPPPLSSFPMEFRNLNLEQIAKQIVEPMGIFLDVADDTGARFDRVNIEQEQTALSFLSNLCGQRNMVISDDEYGSCIVWRGAGVGAPVLRVDDSVQPDVDISVTFDGDRYFSSVTGVVPSKTRKPGQSFTVQNPFQSGIIRPHTYKIDESSVGELETAVNTAAARMFAQVFRVTIKLPGVRDDLGDVLDVNKIIEVRSPDNFINNFSEFIISGVEHNFTESEISSTIEAVLPGAYSGTIPGVLPW